MTTKGRICAPAALASVAASALLATALAGPAAADGGSSVRWKTIVGIEQAANVVGGIRGGGPPREERSGRAPGRRAGGPPDIVGGGRGLGGGGGGGGGGGAPAGAPPRARGDRAGRGSRPGLRPDDLPAAAAPRRGAVPDCSWRCSTSICGAIYAPAVPDPVSMPM